jgi:cold-inducible RNA-binding protein
VRHQAHCLLSLRNKRKSRLGVHFSQLNVAFTDDFDSKFRKNSLRLQTDGERNNYMKLNGCRHKMPVTPIGNPGTTYIIRRNMNSKLYVRNLSASITEEELQKLFMRAGKVVSISLIADRESHRSKGFAFVVMSNQAEAQLAFEMLDGHKLDDQELRVSIVHPHQDRGGQSSHGNRTIRRTSRGGRRS